LFALDVGFFVYVYMMGVYLCIYGLYSDNVIIPWKPTTRADFVAQSFIGFKAVIRVFRALDRFSSASVSKIMAKLPEIN